MKNEMENNENNLPKMENIPEPPPKKEWVTYKTWQDFRDCGMLLVVNMLLHCFGWAITVEVDEHGNAISAKPARVKYRGFPEKDQDEEHIKLANYLAENAPNFPEDIK